MLLVQVVGALLAAAGEAGKLDRSDWIAVFRDRADMRAAALQHHAAVRRELGIIPALVVSLDDGEAAAFGQEPGVVTLEPDLEWRLLEPPSAARRPGDDGTSRAQTVPYGLTMIQAPEAWVVTRGAGALVAVLDTGIDLNHPDLPVPVLTASFVGEPVQDGNGHGSRMAGVVAAVDNEIGVVGVAPEAGLLIGKVLTDAGSGSYADIITGIDWAVQNGADVILISGWGTTDSSALQAAVNAAVAAGVVVVAPSGDNGSQVPAYPAYYASAIAVGAVGADLQRAWFSDYGSWLDLVGPGVLVPSTVPVGTATVASAVWSSLDHQTNVLTGSAMGTVSGAVYWCGLATGGAPEDSCPPEVAGNIAHILRGSITFEAKVAHAEAAGAAGVILSNNVPGNFQGNLGRTSLLVLVTVSQEDGTSLHALGNGTPATISVTTGDYDQFSSTAMAAAHVTGAAALLTSCSDAAGSDIRSALEGTAEDLGTPGRDDEYGYGLVNALDALASLCGSTDLAIAVDDGVSGVLPGDTVTYAITVSNLGPNDALAAMVDDVFPPALTGVTWICDDSLGGTCSAPTGTGDLHQPVDLPAGGGVLFTATGIVDAAAAGSLDDTATVAAGPTNLELEAANNSASDSDLVITDADLSITVSDGETEVSAGETVVYLITVSNAGPRNAVGARVVDQFPAGLSGVSWTCTGLNGGQCQLPPQEAVAGDIDDLVELPVGGIVVYAATGTVAAGAAGTLQNTASVTAPAGLTDPDPSDDSATDVDAVLPLPQADLAVTLDDQVTEARPGQPLTWTVVVSNAGPDAAPAADVVATFPSQMQGMTWACDPAGGASCGDAAGAGNIVQLVDLPPSSSVTYVATGTVDATASGTLSTTAAVAAPSGVVDPAPANNSAVDSEPVILEADLWVKVSSASCFYLPGDTVTYEIRVGSRGPVRVTDALVTDIFPIVLTGVSWTCVGVSGGVCPYTGAGNIADMVELPPDSQVLFTVTASLDPSATGDLLDTVEVASSVVELEPADNAAAHADALQVPLFCDGVDSGDTLAWSQSLP